MKIFVLGILYSAIWIAFSGHFDFLLLSFGVISVLIVLYTLRRMRITDETTIKFQMKLLNFVKYCFWLIKEILKSNITVTKTILTPKIKLKQKELKIIYGIFEIIYLNFSQIFLNKHLSNLGI